MLAAERWGYQSLRCFDNLVCGIPFCESIGCKESKTGPDETSLPSCDVPRIDVCNFVCKDGCNFIFAVYFIQEALEDVHIATPGNKGIHGSMIQETYLESHLLLVRIGENAINESL